MTNVSVATAVTDGKVEGAPEGTRAPGESGHDHDPSETHMTASSATAPARARTGGPKDDGPKILEHVMGWTFVVVLAMLVTQLGWM